MMEDFKPIFFESARRSLTEDYKAENTKNFGRVMNLGASLAADFRGIANLPEVAAEDKGDYLQAAEKLKRVAAAESEFILALERLMEVHGILVEEEDDLFRFSNPIKKAFGYGGKDERPVFFPKRKKILERIRKGRDRMMAAFVQGVRSWAKEKYDRYEDLRPAPPGGWR